MPPYRFQEPSPEPRIRSKYLCDLLDSITKERFEAGRKRRFGTTNPEKIDDAFPNVMVKSGCIPVAARCEFTKLGELTEADCDLPEITEEQWQQLDDLRLNDRRNLEYVDYGKRARAKDRDWVEPSSMFWDGAIFCNYRTGQSETKLSDSTVVQIGGRYEDDQGHDDIVYNDVIVFHPNSKGKIERETDNFDIFGYPEAVFPTTDFHSATYITSFNAILIIGNGSAPEKDEELAKNGITPVYLLKVGTWEMEKKETTGDGPGIILKHDTTLQDGVLRVSKVHGTMRCVVKDREFKKEKIEFDEGWLLDRGTWIWTHEANDWVTVPKKGRERSRPGF